MSAKTEEGKMAPRTRDWGNLKKKFKKKSFSDVILDSVQFESLKQDL